MNTQGDRRPTAASGHAIALSLLALSLAAACGGGAARDPGDGGAPESGDGARPVSFDSVYASQQSGVDASLRAVLRTDEEWRSTWDRLTAGVDHSPPRPQVDFGRHMLLALGLGTRPSGGYAVRVGGLAVESDQLVVTVTEVVPGSGCMATMALTAPVAVLRVDRFDGEVAFVETRVERPCD